MVDSGGCSAADPAAGDPEEDVAPGWPPAPLVAPPAPGDSGGDRVGSGTAGSPRAPNRGQRKARGKGRGREDEEDGEEVEREGRKEPPSEVSEKKRAVRGRSGSRESDARGGKGEKKK